MSSGRVGKAIVLTCLFTAVTGNMGWVFARPVTSGTGVNSGEENATCMQHLFKPTTTPQQFQLISYHNGPIMSCAKQFFTV